MNQFCQQWAEAFWRTSETGQLFCQLTDIISNFQWNAFGLTIRKVSPQLIERPRRCLHHGVLAGITLWNLNRTASNSAVEENNHLVSRFYVYFWNVCVYVLKLNLFIITCLAQKDGSRCDKCLTLQSLLCLSALVSQFVGSIARVKASSLDPINYFQPLLEQVSYAFEGCRDLLR